MARYTGIFLFLICAIIAQAEELNVKDSNVFEYSAVVESVVKKPVEHTSKYQINARLHMVPEGDGYLKIALKNVQYTLFAGKNGQHATKMVPVSTESGAIELPFSVEYNTNLQVKNLFTQATDKEWSINIKRGIATLLQGDLWKIQRSAKTFVSTEKTVYGDCEVQYNMMTTDENKVKFSKYFTMQNCKNSKLITSYNTDDVSECKNGYLKKVLATNDMHYEMQQNDKEIYLIELDAVNKIVVNGLSVIVSQNLKHIPEQNPDNIELVKEKLIQKPIEMTLQSTETPYASLPDLTGGRSTVNMEVFMPKMRQMLSNIVQHLSKSQINPGEPDWQYRNNVVNALQYFRLMDKHCFEHCYEDLSKEQNDKGKEVFEIFLQMLPKVGSHASISFIYETILKNKINENTAMIWLQNVPSYAKYPDRNLLKYLWTLNLQTETPENLRYITLLSYTSLISKAIARFPEMEMQNNEFIDFFINEFRSSATVDEQLKTLAYLHNMGSSRTYKYLLEHVVNDKKYVSHVRYHAIWACKDHKENNEVSDVYWPLLIDTSETLEIRSAALSAILDDYNFDNYMRLHNFMINESNQYLYSYYFTSLKSLSEVKSPCYRTSAKNAGIILGLISKIVMLPVSSVEYIDFNDKSWGSLIKISKIADCKSQGYTNMYLQFTRYAPNFAKNEFAVYLRASKDMIPSGNLLNFNITAISNKVNSDVNVELMIFRNNKVIDLVRAQGNQLFEILEKYNFIKYFQKHESSTKYMMDNALEGEMILPTLLGVPVVSYITSPSIVRLKWNHKLDTSSPASITYKTNMVWSLWNNWLWGLTVYNPLSDVWHGSQQNAVQNAYIPIAVDFNINMEQKNFKMVISREPQSEDNHYGMIYYSNSEVYLQDIGGGDTVKKICPSCLAVYPVTKGITTRQRQTWYERVSDYTGMKYKGLVFGCEKTLSKSKLNEFGKDNAMNMLRNLFGWSYHMSTTPIYEMCGTAVYGEPDQENSVSTIALQMKLSSDSVTKGELNIQKSTLKLSYSLRDVKNEPINSWDLNMNLDFANQRPIAAKANFIKSGQNKPSYQICLDTSNSFDSDELDMNVKVSSGEYKDKSKCPSDIKYDFELKGTLSDQQKQIESGGDLKYFACNPFFILANPFFCTIAQTSLRHYTVNVTHSQLDDNHKQFWYWVSDWWTNIYSKEMNRKVNKESHLPANSHQIIFKYPVETNDIDVVYKNHNEMIEFDGITINYKIGVTVPYTTHISTMFYMAFMQKHLSSCFVNSGNLINIARMRVNHKVSSEWESYMEVPGEWKVLLKQYTDNQMAVRIIAGDKTFDIMPEGNGFKFYLDEKDAGSKLTTGFDSKSVFEYRVLEKEHKILVHLINNYLNVDFDGSSVNIHTVGIPDGGVCVETKYCD